MMIGTLTVPTWLSPILPLLYHRCSNELMRSSHSVCELLFVVPIPVTITTLLTISIDVCSFLRLHAFGLFLNIAVSKRKTNPHVRPTTNKKSRQSKTHSPRIHRRTHLSKLASLKHCTTLIISTHSSVPVSPRPHHNY